ncbi:hypothetical protein IO99_16210 [Clostridium sulfidigenes]|uniref:DUF1648 domain-containing protein n=1 Tax=Clostridium sulfidigenes TaxID=318464 RepID=A0A084J873_9CLOT|nr:DUF1648 domain-containing protein [Clostridium sulfidigenes]KEZ85157.1 hypothetical protein IO99_16210 [Clostridium sulfidigenes]
MKEKVPFTKFQKFLETLALLILLGSIIYLIFIWSTLPDTIPSHYNAKGVVTNWSGKGMLLIMPIISIILYTGLTTITLFPNIWNAPVEITEKNQNFVYTNLKTMLIVLKLILVSDFSYMTICSATKSSLSVLFTPIVLIAVFGTLAFFITRIIKGSKKLE